VTTHATLNGTITATGGENCTQRGFEWGYSTGSYPNSWTESGSFGAVAFNHPVTGLTNAATVFYRAKAYNSAGWGYGGEQSFKTWNTVAPTDSGAGAETFSGQRSGAYTDEGSGVDALASTGIPVTEAAAGAESLAIETSFSIGDAVTGDDQGSCFKPVDLTDDGGAVDSVAELSMEVTVSEAGVLTLEVCSASDLSWIDMSDSATGYDGTITIEFTVTDSGTLDNELVNLDRSFLDGGAGSEETTFGIPVQDSGMGADYWLVEASFTITDAGSGVDYWWAAQAFIDQSDSGVGVESSLSFEVSFTMTDANGSVIEAIDAMLSPLIMYDSAIGVEFAWRLKGSCLLDDFALPHVLMILIVDEAVMSDKKIHPPALPKRKLIGKPGRVVEIEGWTRSQTDVDDLRALDDGAAHIFIHPSGDTMKVLVRDFNVDRTADEYNRRRYQMSLAECS